MVSLIVLMGRMNSIVSIFPIFLTADKSCQNHVTSNLNLFIHKNKCTKPGDNGSDEDLIAFRVDRISRFMVRLGLLFQ